MLVRWRHQISAIAQAGFHDCARPTRLRTNRISQESVEAYANILQLTSDIVGLVHALDREAIIVGYDQGAPLAWHCTLLRPDLFKAIALLRCLIARIWDSQPQRKPSNR